MKTLFVRAVVVLALLLAMLLAVSTALAQGPIQSLLNGNPSDKFAEAPSAVDCAILDFTGMSTTTVHASDLIADLPYYLQYDSGGKVSTSVSFTVKPAFSGSPLASQKQIFHPNSAQDITTPFGIPSWPANRTVGQWKLIVRNNSGQTHTCFFNVVFP